jgi:hypothetical protein
MLRENKLFSLVHVKNSSRRPYQFRVNPAFPVQLFPQASGVWLVV